MYIIVEIFDTNENEKYKPSFYKIEDKYIDEIDYEDKIMKLVRNDFTNIEDNYYDEYFEIEIYYVSDNDFITIDIND